MLAFSLHWPSAFGMVEFILVSYVVLCVAYCDPTPTISTTETIWKSLIFVHTYKAHKHYIRILTNMHAAIEQMKSLMSFLIAYLFLCYLVLCCFHRFFVISFVREEQKLWFDNRKNESYMAIDIGFNMVNASHAVNKKNSYFGNDESKMITSETAGLVVF